MSALYSYTPSRDADLLLAQLWARMDADGDLANLFADPQTPLSTLLNPQPAPHELLYATDDTGIWFAVWFNRILCGAFVAAYVRPDMRASLAALLVFRRALEAGMRAYGTLLGITEHGELLDLHYALGYKLVGMVPAIFPGGRDGWLLSRTPTEKERARWHGSQHLDQAVAVPQPELAPEPLPLAAP